MVNTGYPGKPKGPASENDKYQILPNFVFTVTSKVRHSMSFLYLKDVN